MTIDSAFRFVSYVANKEVSGVITPAQFNLLAPLAQLSFVNDRIANVKKYRPHDPVPEYGWNITQKIKEELSALYTSQVVTLTSGVGPMPTNFLYLDVLLTPAGSPPQRIIEEKNVDEFMILKASAIKPPTATYPIFYRVATNIVTNVVVAPTTFATCQMFYVRQPTDPVWGYDIVNDVPVYNSLTSQDFQTARETHLAVCQLILQNIGINLDMQQLEQYAQLEQQKGS